MRLIDAEPIERELFKRADKSPAKNPYENAKICAFRQAFELVVNACTIASPPNDPLTLEELREMDGEPVYVQYPGGGGEWGLVGTMYGYDHIEICFKHGLENVVGMYGLFSRGAVIYRRKPKELEGGIGVC